MLVTSLSSGSSGNCYLVQGGGHNILIDCGLSSAKIIEYLKPRRLSMEQLSAIFITHEHSDHLRSAGAISRRWGVPVYANANTLAAAKPSWEKILRTEQQKAAQIGATVPDATGTYNLRILPTGSSVAFGGLEVQSFAVSHDATETVCYTFRADGQQATILTDLGCETENIYEHLNNSKLIILEANHSIDTLLTSRYPYSLKRRISGDYGHLSNEQSAPILRRVLEESGTERTIWLAHLSEQNNSPEDALGYFVDYLELHGVPLNFPLAVALRDKPSLVYDSANPPKATPLIRQPRTKKLKLSDREEQTYQMRLPF